MKVIKIKRLSLANAVMAGGSEQLFMSDEQFEMTLRDGVVIDIVHKRNQLKTQTSLFNVKWWEEADPTPSSQPTPESGQKRGPGRPRAGA